MTSIHEDPDLPISMKACDINPYPQCVCGTWAKVDGEHYVTAG